MLRFDLTSERIRRRDQWLERRKKKSSKLHTASYTDSRKMTQKLLESALNANITP